MEELLFYKVQLLRIVGYIGDDVYRLGIDLDTMHTPTGVETLIVNAADATSIYDAAGNAAVASQSGTDNQITLNDQSPPTLTQVTAITTPSNDTTPSYVFTSGEAGTLTSTLGFSTSSSISTGSNQTVTFNALSEGTYSGATITVTDAAGNAASLTIPDFVIDTTAPTLTQVTAITTPSNDTTPSYVFTSGEAGTLTSTLGFSTSSCSSISTGSNQTVTFNALSEGTYSGATITVTDAAGNASSLTIPDFVIDTTAPTLTQVTAITTPSNDTTPRLCFYKW